MRASYFQAQGEVEAVDLPRRLKTHPTAARNRQQQQRSSSERLPCVPLLQTHLIFSYCASLAHFHFESTQELRGTCTLSLESIEEPLARLLADQSYHRRLAFAWIDENAALMKHDRGHRTQLD